MDFIGRTEHITERADSPGDFIMAGLGGETAGLAGEMMGDGSGVMNDVSQESQRGSV